MQVGTEASRHSEGFRRNSMLSKWCLVCRASERYDTSSGRMEQWTDDCPDEMTRRLDGWQGTENFWLVNSSESSETLLNSGIPVKKHLYIQVILSKQNEANYNLTTGLILFCMLVLWCCFHIACLYCLLFKKKKKWGRKCREFYFFIACQILLVFLLDISIHCALIDYA
jgi:hypothetical protein